MLAAGVGVAVVGGSYVAYAAQADAPSYRTATASVGDVEEILGLKTVGVIPESGDVLNASNKGEPVILETESDAAQAYDDAVARLLGDTRPMRFITAEKKGFFSKIFGG